MNFSQFNNFNYQKIFIFIVFALIIIIFSPFVHPSYAIKEIFELVNAAAEGNESKVNILLKKGVNVNAATFERVTALMVASENGHTGIVKTLLRKGADPNIKDRQQGLNALMLASAGGHTEIVKLLLAYGSDVNEKDSNNQATALIGASAYGYVEIINLLIKKKADPNAKNRDGLTSISIAAINGHLGAVKVLIEAGANIDVQDEKYGANALIGSAANGHDAIIKFLLDHGAKVNLRANNGLTALGFAKEKNRKSTVQLLQNFCAIE